MQHQWRQNYCTECNLEISCEHEQKSFSWQFLEFFQVFPGTWRPMLLLSKVMIRSAGSTVVEMSIVSKDLFIFLLKNLSAKHYTGCFEVLITVVSNTIVVAIWLNVLQYISLKCKLSSEVKSVNLGGCMFACVSGVICAHISTFW